MELINGYKVIDKSYNGINFIIYHEGPRLFSTISKDLFDSLHAMIGSKHPLSFTHQINYGRLVFIYYNLERLFLRVEQPGVEDDFITMTKEVVVSLNSYKKSKEKDHIG